MRMLGLFATSIALIGISQAFADSPGGSVGTATAEAPRGAPNAQSEYPGWARVTHGDGSIMRQAKLVFAALRDETVEPEVTAETTYVAKLEDDGTAAGIPDGNGSAGCKFMEIPGSRIRERRCYYPSEAEMALNRYQFTEEIRYAIQKQQHLEMLRQEAEAMVQTYGRMFQRR